nr:Dabb family protein [uncultured Caproiciproducens sp.]
MVKHIVLWTLTEEAKKSIDTVAQNFQKQFKALLGVVDGLTAIEIGRNYNGGNFDLVLSCEFTTKEAQEKYQNHPAHLAVKKIVHSVVCGRDCVDYEI